MRYIKFLSLICLLTSLSLVELKAQAADANPFTDTVPKKQISSVDVNRNKNQVTIIYADSTAEVLTEQEAAKRGLVNNGGYSNFKAVNVPPQKGQWFRKSSSSVTPLIVLGGREITEEEMNNIDAKDIESINILKDKKAIEKYGIKGKNGVAEIELKKTATNIDTLMKDVNKFTGAQDDDVIVSYTLIGQDEEKTITKIDVTGETLPPSAKKFISRLKKGNTIIIQNIVINRKGIRTKLPARTYTL